jgi:hypothetical protein
MQIVIYQWYENTQFSTHYSLQFASCIETQNMIHSPDSNMIFFNFPERHYVFKYPSPTGKKQKEKPQLISHENTTIHINIPVHALYYDKEKKITYLIYPQSCQNQYDKNHIFNLLNIVKGTLSKERAHSIDHFHRFPNSFTNCKSIIRQFRPLYQHWDYPYLSGLVLTQYQRKNNRKCPHKTKDCTRHILWLDAAYGTKSWFRFALPAFPKDFKFDDTHLLLGGNRSFLLCGIQNKNTYFLFVPK